MRSPLVRLNSLRWYKRLPCKWAILGLTLFLVQFPYPRLAWRHFSRLGNPNRLIQPDAPALQPWLEEIRASLPSDLPPREALQRVQEFVYAKVPYEWDWNTWGLADYFPTVEEVVAQGKEDCDGQAIVAASLLRNLGYDARLVTDLAHMWVATSHGETMNPGRSRVFEATDQGMKMRFPYHALRELPRATVYGIAVFPLFRESIVLCVLWFVLLRPGGGVGCQLAALAFLVNALLFLRISAPSYERQILWRQWIGLANFVAAGVALFIWASRNARLIASAHAPPDAADSP